MTASGDSPRELDMIAASLRADTTDLGAFAESLAIKLEQAIPGLVKVERRRDGVFGAKVVRRIAVQAGDRRLELRRAGAGIDTVCGKVSGGIVLKTEPLPIDAWLATLGESLADEASRSETTRRALERLLTE